MGALAGSGLALCGGDGLGDLGGAERLWDLQGCAKGAFGGLGVRARLFELERLVLRSSVGESKVFCFRPLEALLLAVRVRPLERKIQFQLVVAQDSGPTYVLAAFSSAQPHPKFHTLHWAKLS